MSADIDRFGPNGEWVRFIDYDAPRARVAELERERDESARAWREAVDGMHRRAMSAEAALAKAREALEPFATVGKMIDGAFGPALFAEDEQAFKSGCAWLKNGEPKTLTWGDFRRARAALAPEGK